MESKYISRVLSHIKNKNRRKAIDAELSDHLDEKGKEYLDLGYEADGALAISETAMGDADVVGEQFDSLMKENKHSLFSIVVFSAVICLFIVFGFIQMQNNEVLLFELPDTLLKVTLVCLLRACCIFNVYIALRSKRFAQLIFGNAALAVSLYLQPSYIFFTLTALLSGNPPMDLFYSNDLAVNLFTDYYAVGVSIFVILAVMTVLEIVAIVKTHLLKNSKADVILLQVMKRTASLTVCVIFCFNIYAGVSCVFMQTYRQQRMSEDVENCQRTAVELLSTSEANGNSLVEGVMRFTTPQDAANPVPAEEVAAEVAEYASEIYEEAAASDTPVSNTAAWQTAMRSFYHRQTTYSQIELLQVNSTLGVLLIQPKKCLNPLSTRFELEDADKPGYFSVTPPAYSDVAGCAVGSFISDVPLPADVMFYRTSERSVYFYYRNYDLGLVYTYDGTTQQYVLSEITHIDSN